MEAVTFAAVQTQTPDFWEYVIAGYAFATVLIGGFVIRLVRRGRNLARQVPPDKRRWL
ncbi:MAG: hypothetical protein JST73_06280 [Actinobacteria bacterium]|nr:hypothetical protein [Actinomycetota bacterium]